MLAEPQASRETGPKQVANLVDITFRRSPYAVAQKGGDITAALAALPAKPEVLDSVVIPMPGIGKMRDITPDAAASSRDIQDYWKRLRGSDIMPPRDRLKASEVAARWSNLVLFRCSGGAAGMHPDSAFSTALRANRGAAAGMAWEPETTALLSQWMLRVARAVAAAGAPARERLHIDTANGRVEYAMITLPFAGDGGETPGYVLCQVEPLA